MKWNKGFTWKHFEIKLRYFCECDQLTAQRSGSQIVQHICRKISNRQCRQFELFFLLFETKKWNESIRPKTKPKNKLIRSIDDFVFYKMFLLSMIIRRENTAPMPSPSPLSIKSVDVILFTVVYLRICDDFIYTFFAKISSVHNQNNTVKCDGGYTQHTLIFYTLIDNCLQHCISQFKKKMLSFPITKSKLLFHMMRTIINAKNRRKHSAPIIHCSGSLGICVFSVDFVLFSFSIFSWIPTLPYSFTDYTAKFVTFFHNQKKIFQTNSNLNSTQRRCSF